MRTADSAAAALATKAAQDSAMTRTSDATVAAGSPVFGNAKSFAPPKPPKVSLPAPPLPLSDPEPTSKAPAERRKGEYALPPLALLDAPKTERKIDERELMDGARLLEEKCREFSVEGTVVQIHPGPVVTTFEFKPDAGVKYSKITGLADDLCLAMQAESVLIDRIPGKSTVGIQIPNRNREQISLRELLESDAYRRSTSKLTIALGKTIHGEPYVADLATMPHLLIAGSTGAGKSVGINGMLTSILYRATPDDVRMIMIDPEAARARDVRGHPAPDDAGRRRSEAGGQRAALGGARDGRALQDARGRRRPQHRAVQPQRPAGDRREAHADGRREPQAAPLHRRRHRRARRPDDGGEQRGRGIDRAARADGARGRHPPDPRDAAAVGRRHHRPDQGQPAGAHLVPRLVEDRLADDSRRQRRRAAARQGRHAVPAAGLVALHPRCTAPYISEQESARLASFLRKQGKPVYDETITAEEKSATDGIEMDKDDLYDEAARIVVQSGQASISYLQRRLRIGFSRAARLVDMMEMEGLVSPAAGGKPREVLVDKDYFDEVDAQLR